MFCELDAFLKITLYAMHFYESGRHNKMSAVCAVLECLACFCFVQIQTIHVNNNNLLAAALKKITL